LWNFFYQNIFLYVFKMHFTSVVTRSESLQGQNEVFKFCQEYVFMIDPYFALSYSSINRLSYFQRPLKTGTAP
jgi:hypothetical protein